MQLEEAELRLNQWIADGKSLDLCDELADIASLAALAKEYRLALSAEDPAALTDLTRRARVALIPKSSSDRCGAMLLFNTQNDLAAELETMYTCFAEELHCRVASVSFSDGCRGLCLLAGDLVVYPYMLLKNETGLHLCGDKRCAITVFPLHDDASSNGCTFEAFSRPDDQRIHKTNSCVRASRGDLVCESLTLRTAAQNRDLALSALTARQNHPCSPTHIIRDYDFDRGILNDHRLDKCFSIGDLQPLFDSLLLAE